MALRTWITRGVGVLIVAGAVVGGAIATSGTVSRALNAIGGLGWMAAAGLWAWTLRRSPGRGRSAAAVLESTLLLAMTVRPSDLAAAAVGFAVAGAAVAAVAGSSRLGWAALVPALWLPIHIGLAIGRSFVAGEARVRTGPPPTTALVPLTMVMAACLGGAVVEVLASRRAGTIAAERQRV